MRRARQQELDFRTERRGGKRANAGRKRRAARPQVPHRTRRELDGRTPVHVTVRVVREVDRLRTRDQYREIERALRRTGNKPDFRICQFTVQGNHLHLVAEPRSKDALRRGMTAFLTSAARRLNGRARRRGKVWADRYHVRYLETPSQVRRALCYTLNNFRRHGEHRRIPDWDTDPFSSADCFDGFRGGYRPRPPPVRERADAPPVAPPRFWLLKTGWRRHGLLDPREVPGPR